MFLTQKFLVQTSVKRFALILLSSLLVISALFAATSSAYAKPKFAKVCKPSIIRAAGSLRLDRYLGKVSARIFWRGKVKKRYGWKYAAWSLAKNKSMRCRLRNKGRYYRCLARARPCTVVRVRR